MLEFQMIRNIQDAIDLEQSSYPPDEAASIDSILTRFNKAAHLQLCGYIGSELVAMVMATSTKGIALSWEHEPGSTICIHSLVVKKPFRNKGYAREIMQQYLRNFNGMKFEKICIIVHSELIEFYKRFGFVDKGRSAIQHGSSHWNDMVLYF